MFPPADRGRLALAALRRVGRLPLPLLRGIGALLGWIAYTASARYRRKLRHNLRRAGLDSMRMRWRAAGEAGRTLGELPYVWTRPLETIAARVASDDRGLLHEVESAQRGILFVTPHLGAFDVAARWYATRAPITVLYKPPRQAWLRPLVASVRNREQMNAVAPTVGGLRAMLRALRARQAVALLPDQVPGAGDGRWVPFFGEPAYTMTLPERLVAQTGARVVVIVCERVSRPAGWRVHVESLDEMPSAEVLNARMERCILRYPAQYLWGYNRYRRPASAPSVPSAASPPCDEHVR